MKEMETWKRLLSDTESRINTYIINLIGCLKWENKTDEMKKSYYKFLRWDRGKQWKPFKTVLVLGKNNNLAPMYLESMVNHLLNSSKENPDSKKEMFRVL